MTPPTPETHKHVWHVTESGDPYHDPGLICADCPAQLEQDEANAFIAGLRHIAQRYQQMVEAWQIDWERTANDPSYKPEFNGETLELRAALAALEKKP